MLRSLAGVGTPADNLFTMGKGLKEFHFCDSRRLRKKPQDAQLIPLRHCGGILFSVFALAVDRFVTIGRRTAQFCFGLLMRCLFLGSPPSPS